MNFRDVRPRSVINHFSRSQRRQERIYGVWNAIGGIVIVLSLAAILVAISYGIGVNSGYDEAVRICASLQIGE